MRMRIVKAALIGLLLALATPLTAFAQCSTQAPAGTFCGNISGVTALPGWRALSAAPLTVGTTPILSGTTLAPLFNNGGILGNGSISSTWSTFLQSGTGAVSRTVQAKLRERINAADFGTVAQAVDAIKANNGGTLDFACGIYALGSGSKGIDFDNATYPVRLTGNGNAMSGATCIQLSYSGTGTIISAKGAHAMEIDHLSLYSTTAAIGIDLGEWPASTIGAVFPNVHDNYIQVSGNPAQIGIKIDKNQGPVIEKNFLGVTGTGIYIACGAAEWATSPVINKNTFGAGGQTSIACPSGSTMVSNNIAQFPVVAFIGKGVSAFGCDVVNVQNNWIGDYTVPATAAIVDSNCSSLLSSGNTYAGMAGMIGIRQANSTGSVQSIGDEFTATTGIDIGTGNKLFVSRSSITPGTLVVGTPTPALASETWFSIGAANGISLSLGNLDFFPAYTNKVSIGTGLDNAIIGVGQSSANNLSFAWAYNAIAANAVAAIATASYANPLTINANNVNINQASGGATNIYNSGAAPTGTGAYVRGTSPTLATPVINGLPTGTGVATANTASTLVARDASGNFSAGTITATTFAGTATNTVNSGITDDTTTNATMFPVWVTTASGNRPLRVTSTTLSWNPSLIRLGVGTASPLATLHVGSGADVSALSPGFYVNNAGTASFAVRDSTNDIEMGMFTSTSGGGLVAMGTRTSHPFWIQTNSANIAAFHVSAGLSVGTTTDPGVGVVGALGGFSIGTAARTLTFKQGANGAVGTFTCVSASNVTVSNSYVAANDNIVITYESGTAATTGGPHVNTKTVATSFRVGCQSGDTAVYNYAIFKSAA